MNKECISVDKFLECRRNEIINKFSIDVEFKEQVTREELLAIIEKIEDKQEKINKRKPIEKKVIKATLEDKRSEIVGKIKNVVEENLIEKDVAKVNISKDEKSSVDSENQSKNMELNFVEEYFDYMRSEIINKFEIEEIIKKQTTDEKLELIINKVTEKQKELSKRKPIEKEVKKASFEDKRSEIVGKFMEIDSVIAENENRNDKIFEKSLNEIDNSVINDKFDDNSEENIENADDKVQENVENISIAMIVLVVVFCLVVGAVVGYMLYSIAMSNS